MRALFLALLLGLAGAVSAAPVLQPQVLATHPHDRTAFTQGLAWADGWLYESTGLYGESSLRRYRPDGSEGLLKRLPKRLFGEGLAVVDGRLIQLTWRAGLALVYDRHTLRYLDRFRYRGEGWGLAWDGHHLYHSDGSDRILVRDPDTFRTVRLIRVRDDDGPVERLNELEWVAGELWANVFETPRIARIDPDSGRVKGWIDLARLRPEDTLGDALAVANGIAYDPQGQRLFVTGKRWPVLYELALPADLQDQLSNQSSKRSAGMGGAM